MVRPFSRGMHNTEDLNSVSTNAIRDDVKECRTRLILWYCEPCRAGLRLDIRAE